MSGRFAYGFTPSRPEEDLVEKTEEIGSGTAAYLVPPLLPGAWIVGCGVGWWQD